MEKSTIVKKKRKYYRKCGICGERLEQSQMIRDSNSPNGWVCESCYHEAHEHEEILESIEDW